jgi:hypothetical protein
MVHLKFHFLGWARAVCQWAGAEHFKLELLSRWISRAGTGKAAALPLAVAV